MLEQAGRLSQAEICKLHQIAQGRNNSTGSCGVPVLYKIRIAASPVQVGRPFGFVPPVSERGARSGFRAGVRQRLPPAHGLSTSAEALCQRGLLGSGFLAGPFQRRLGPDDPAWSDRPDGAVRSGGAEHPAPRLRRGESIKLGRNPDQLGNPGQVGRPAPSVVPLLCRGTKGSARKKCASGNHNRAGNQGQVGDSGSRGKKGPNRNKTPSPGNGAKPGNQGAAQKSRVERLFCPTLEA